MINTDMILNGIECFHHTSANFLTGSNPPYHRHENSYEIYLFIKGNIMLYVEQNCYKPSIGDLIIVRPDELHRSIIKDGNSAYERIGINIHTSILDELSSTYTNLRNFLDNITGRSPILRLSPSELNTYIALTDSYLNLTQKISAACSKTIDAAIDIEAVQTIIQLLILINSSSVNTTAHEYTNYMPQIVIDAMEYINNNYTDNITLNDISLTLNYSSNYISLQFKRQTGLTIREYIFDKRIEAAKIHLLNGCSVSDACSFSGFNDYSNFIRSFTKKTGISPGKYAGNRTTSPGQLP